MKTSFATLFVIICCSLIFAACGKRGDPLPPSLVVPVKIDDLRVEVTPGKRQLKWSIPKVNADDSRPVDLKDFRIRLKKLPLDQDACRFCDEGFNDYLTIALEKPSVGYVLGPSFYLPLPDVPVGYVYIYSLLSLNSRGWTSEASNKLAVLSLPKVLAPSKLILQPSASVVELHWQAPALPPHFKGALRYRVYRRDAQDPNQLLSLITPEPIDDTEYIDVGLSDWSSYEYVVTSLVAEEETFYESNFSSIVQVVPGDYTPPDMLLNFSAFNFQGGIQLVWTPSFAADLAGYRVYRRDDVTGIDQILVVLSPAKHELFDSTAQSGRAYHYRVTAFDRSDRKNESVPTPEISVTVK